MAKAISEELFNARRTLNNIKNHNYTVADYRICSEEAEVIIKALEKHVKDVSFDEGLKI